MIFSRKNYLDFVEYFDVRVTSKRIHTWYEDGAITDHGD